MLKSIRTIMILGCLVFPLASFGAFKFKKNANSDPELTARIQKAIAKDYALQSDAGTVSVTVQNGVVTLKGTVRSDERRVDMQGVAELVLLRSVPDDQIHTAVIHNELTVPPK
jgi:hypothetical protein